MHTNTVFASLIALAKLVSSAPADATSIPPPAASASTSNPANCIVPLVIFSTIDKPFTLSALTLDDKSSIPWAVLLKSPSNTVETRPFISRTKIAQPLFRLTGGNLTTIGASADEESQKGSVFPAYFGPKIQIFPPVPDPLLFGVFQDPYSGFGAGYSCDKDGKAYLELRADPSQPELTFLNIDSERGFVVPKLAEGEQISGKPVGYQGTATTIHLKINQSS